MRFCKPVFILLIALVITIAFSIPGKAMPGAPLSTEAGFGVRLNLAGDQIPQSLRYAGILHVDWVAIDFDWANDWPDANGQPDIQRLDNAMQFASQNKLAVLLRLKNAPDWAKSTTGPDPQLTAWFVVNMLNRYSATIQAVELFPGANTKYGWGANPDAGKYINLLKSVTNAIKDAKLVAFLVGPGLSPLPSGKSTNPDVNDLEFLSALYDAGAQNYMPVVSICLPEITGDPLKSPSDSESRVFRHYENVRQVMLEHHHENGLIWITEFSLPSGQIDPNDVSYINNPSGQVQWLSQAYNILRSQLYVGVAFLTTINPNPVKSQNDAASICLIRTDLSKHPFYSVLREIILQGNPAKVILLDFNKPQSKNISKNHDSPP